MYKPIYTIIGCFSKLSSIFVHLLMHHPLKEVRNTKLLLILAIIYNSLKKFRLLNKKQLILHNPPGEFLKNLIIKIKCDFNKFIQYIKLNNILVSV
jgi:hypothetical protein